MISSGQIEAMVLRTWDDNVNKNDNENSGDVDIVLRRRVGRARHALLQHCEHEAHTEQNENACVRSGCEKLNILAQAGVEVRKNGNLKLNLKPKVKHKCEY